MSASQGEATDKELIEAVKECTPAGTSEVAEHVGLTRQATDYRLQQLEDSGPHPWVWSKKVGPTKVWLHRTHVPPR